MSNELYDTQMITKTQKNNTYTFNIKTTITTIWMSQQTLSDFFEVKRSEIIKHLAQQLKLHQLDKKQHLRTISYVKSGKAIQEQQYSITVIMLIAFQLQTPVAVAFQHWVINHFERFVKWGLLFDTSRITASNERTTYTQRFIKKF